MLYVRTINSALAREHQQHEERPMIATRCMSFSFPFLVFFCVDDRSHPRPTLF